MAKFRGVVEHLTTIFAPSKGPVGAKGRLAVAGEGFSRLTEPPGEDSAG